MEFNTIDVRSCKTIYMNPNHNEKYKARKNYMDSFLTSNGFTNFQHFQSGTYPYPQCLVEATIHILQANMNDTPLLVLEDDIELMPNSSFTLTIPSTTDAVYLGFSRSAGHPTENRHEGCAKLEEASNGMVRILNMLGGHAILYCSQAYKQAVVDILTEFKETHYNDVLFSRIQASYYVLSPFIPLFFQSSKWNDGRAHEEWATKITVFHEGKTPRLPPA